MRTRLLMPDLIALPEQFAQLVGLVTGLSASFHDLAAATDRRLTSIETDVSTLKADVGTLKIDVESLTGSDLELRARLNILNIAMNELALTRGRILLAAGRDTDHGFLEAINAAEEAGRITEQQADHVMVADIIIRARRADDKRYVHVAAWATRDTISCQPALWVSRHFGWSRWKMPAGPSSGRCRSGAGGSC